jgi:hypothetical protein
MRGIKETVSIAKWILRKKPLGKGFVAKIARTRLMSCEPVKNGAARKRRQE